MSAETTMRDDHWRVRSLGPHAWGIYPPGWDLDGGPLLMFISQVQAMRAAARRADFSATPPVTQEDWRRQEQNWRQQERNNIRRLKQVDP